MMCLVMYPLAKHKLFRFLCLLFWETGFRKYITKQQQIRMSVKTYGMIDTCTVTTPNIEDNQEGGECAPEQQRSEDSA